jgi:hypothetical protein
LSIYGSMQINKINSKAGLGTLDFKAEMNNLQVSVLFDNKNEGNLFIFFFSCFSFAFILLLYIN